MRLLCSSTLTDLPVPAPPLGLKVRVVACLLNLDAGLILDQLEMASHPISLTLLLLVIIIRKQAGVEATFDFDGKGKKGGGR